MSTARSREFFVSYSSRDRQSVSRIVDELRRRDVPVWFDQHDLRPFDSELSERIARGIADSRATLAYVTDHYLRSDACMWELLSTLKQGGIDRLFVVAEPGARTEFFLLRETMNATLDRAVPDESQVAQLVDGALDRLAAVAPNQGRRQEAHWWLSGEAGTGPQTEAWQGSAFAGRFHERIWLLDALSAHLGSPGSANRSFDRAQIVGLGGQGKSLLALQFARDFQGRYEAIARFDGGGDRVGDRASNEKEVLEGVLGQLRDWVVDQSERTGTDVALPERRSPAEWQGTRSAAADIVTAHSGRVLWIIDDVPPGLPRAALHLLLCPGAGQTILTTRHHDYDADFLESTLSLPPLDLAEAVYLLAGGVGPAIEQQGHILERIAESVGRHALALAVLAPRIRAWSAQGVLDRLTGRPTTAVAELERAARRITDLPAGHAASIVATLEMSIRALEEPTAVEILRLATLWPRALPMPFALLEAVVGPDAIEGTQELVSASLADKDSAEAMRVHALVSGVAAHLAGSGTAPWQESGQEDEHLRITAALWLDPRLGPEDVWDAADAGRAAWHLLEPIQAGLDEVGSRVAARALLAMARLPMRHKPADLPGAELVAYLEVPLAWARQAESLRAGASKAQILDASQARAMQGLLTLGQADAETDDARRVSLARRGCLLLEDVIEARLPLTGGSANPADRRALVQAQFNLGRGGLVLAKALSAVGQSGVATALDDASAAYADARDARQRDLDALEGPPSKPAPCEDLASCHRGLGIVAYTRVVHQPGLDPHQRVQQLEAAVGHLASARRQTVAARSLRAALPEDVGSAEMAKDLEVLAKVRLAGSALRAWQHDRAVDAEQVLAEVRGALDPDIADRVAGDLVPWGPTDRAELGSGEAPGFLELARLRVHESRGGRGRPARAVLADFDSDLAALLRTLRTGGSTNEQ